jgi:hypothetical protein
MKYEVWDEHGKLAEHDELYDALDHSKVFAATKKRWAEVCTSDGVTLGATIPVIYPSGAVMNWLRKRSLARQGK